MTKEEAIDILKNSIADFVIGEYCKKCADWQICDTKNEDCYFQQAIDIVINLIQKQDAEINKLNNVIDRIKNKLEEHIKHCEQEVKGSLNNEICNISLKFDKGLLETINMEDK